MKFLADSLTVQVHNAQFSLQDTDIRRKSAGKTTSQFARITSVSSRIEEKSPSY